MRQAPAKLTISQLLLSPDANEVSQAKTADFYGLLVCMVNQIGWDEFAGLRKRVFLLQGEEPDALKTLINPWLDRLMGTLFEELRTLQALQLNFPRAEERSREEWQQLALLCQRMQRPQLELQCLQQVEARTVNPDKPLLFRLAQLQTENYTPLLQQWYREHRETDTTWMSRL